MNGETLFTLLVANLTVILLISASRRLFLSLVAINWVFGFGVLIEQRFSLVATLGFSLLCLTSIFVVVVAKQTKINRSVWQAELKSEQESRLKADQVKSEFLDTLTHELRIPLNTIVTPAKSLYLGLIKAPDDQRKFLKLIVDGSERMLRQIDQVLDLSALEAGQLKEALSPEPVHQLIEDTVAQFQGMAFARNLILRTEILPGTPAIVRCDAKKVKSILSNLVSNALKFTEAGSVVLTVSATDSRWSITISDTGIGMNIEETEHIFDRFYQVDRGLNRKYEGTGIGLALVKEYVVALHGEIVVKTERGQGSTFIVSLPLNRGSSQ